MGTEEQPAVGESMASLVARGAGPPSVAGASLFSNDSTANFADYALAPSPAGPRTKPHHHSLLPLCAAIIFIVMYTIPVLPQHPTEQTTLAILVMVLFLWATDCIPPYATAYLVPVLGTWLNVGLDRSTQLRLKASTLATNFAHAFMDNVVFVFFGSMTIAAALAKLNITDRIGRFVFQRLARNPRWILLTLMLLNVAGSTLLSSATTTTMLLSMSMPIIRSLDPGDPFILALLFGLGWSGSAGAMSTTISSPPNLLALKFMDEMYNGQTVSLGVWTVFGFPCACLVTLIEWLYLIVLYPARKKTIDLVLPPADFGKWTLKHTAACIITVATIVIWGLEEEFASVLGNIGITSLIPVICFFGSKILTVQDFHAIRWNTLSLMGGGLCMGEAMRQSGLLDLISSTTKHAFGQVPTWPLVMVFLAFSGAFGSLINSSSAGAILYPVIGNAGELKSAPVLFMALSALMVDGSSLFHMSCFSNALVFGVCKHQAGMPERVTSTHFLKWGDFPRVGWPTLFIRAIVVGSIGYGLARALGVRGDVPTPAA